MTLTQKVTREEVATTDGDIILPKPEIVASRKEEKYNDENLETEKREKANAEWIDRPLKPPSSNEDEEYGDKEEDVGAPLASI